MLQQAVVLLMLVVAVKSIAPRSKRCLREQRLCRCSADNVVRPIAGRFVQHRRCPEGRFVYGRREGGDVGGTESAFRLAQRLEMHVVAMLFSGTFHTSNMKHYM